MDAATRDGAVLDALLDRGFLAVARAEGVVLPPGSAAAGDLATLRRVLREHGGRLRDDGIIEWSSTCDVTGARAVLLNIPTVHAWAPSGWAGYQGVQGGWTSFMATTFGARVPVEQLDTDVALVVKALPLIGVMTLSSCSGHGSGPGRLWFRSQHDLRWAALVLTHVAGVAGLEIEAHPGDWRGDVLLLPTPVGVVARRAGRVLLRHGTRIRLAKSSLRGEDDLRSGAAVESLRRTLGEPFPLNRDWAIRHASSRLYRGRRK